MENNAPVESALTELADDRSAFVDPADFQSDVWREIRHRRALQAHADPLPRWQFAWMTLAEPRSAFAAASIAFIVGATLAAAQSGNPKPTNQTSHHLDLTVFSASAAGLPSNALAARK